MRSFALVLLAGVLFAPHSFAQSPMDAPTLSIAPFAAPIHPLQAALETNITLTLSCVSDTPGRPAHATVWVAEKPAWATAVVSPEMYSAPEGCTTSTTTYGTLRVTANQDAPARKPGRIVLNVAQVDPTGNRTRAGDVTLTSSYFSITDAQLVDTVKTAKPGSTVEYPLKLTNFGNAATRVNITATDVAPGLTVAPIPDITLGSTQQRDTNISQDVTIRVTAATGVGYLNSVGVITLNVSSFEAATGEAGDRTTLSMVLTTKGLNTPLTTLTPLLALALATTAKHKRTK